MSFNIEVVGGSSVRLPTKGKYCDRDIVVTATGDGTEVTNALLDGSITELHSGATKVVRYACYQRNGLVRVNLPNATQTSTYSFGFCENLKSFNAPNLITLGDYNFYSCSSLEEIVLPKAVQVLGYAFYNCTALKKADFSVLGSISPGAFKGCSNLEALILRKTNAICTLSSGAFKDSPVENGTCYVYVPASLVDTYKTDDKWSTYANQIRAIEDYPEITGG